MKITITLLFLIIIQFSFINKSQSQIMLWDEKYAETVFSDDFLGTSLNTDKWDVTIYKRDIGLLIDSSATYKVNNGNLELTMIYCPNCEATDYSGKTYNGNYAGAEIESKPPRFQYGIFECRAKFATNLGSWPAFWIIGGDGTPCPPGGYGNEIDIAELKCQTWLTKMGHVIHRYYPPEDCDVSNVVVKDIDIYNIQLNDIYYNYKCIWTPNKISYYINNNLMHEVQNTGQEWYPELYLQVKLSQQIITASNILGQFTVVTPQTSYFDKVSVKRFFSTPEITVPDLICTNGTAIMDIDNDASNITWSLTPTSLFSGATTGTGKTVAITAATGASGQGKLTYTFYMPSGEQFTAEKSFWVGKPGTPLTTPSGYPTLELGLGAYQPISLFKTPGFTGGNINWWSTGSITPYGSTTGTTCTFEAVSLGTGNFYVTVQNTCGTSPTGGGTVNVVLGGGGQMMLVLSPNPASEETLLSIEPKTTEITFDETAEWDLEVYDQSQSLKEKKTKLKGKVVKIKTAGWKEGIYIVRVKYKDEILTAQLAVKNN